MISFKCKRLHKIIDIYFECSTTQYGASEISIRINSKMMCSNHVCQNAFRIIKIIVKPILVLNNEFYLSNPVEHDRVYKPDGVH